MLNFCCVWVTFLLSIFCCCFCCGAFLVVATGIGGSGITYFHFSSRFSGNNSRRPKRRLFQVLKVLSVVGWNSQLPILRGNIHSPLQEPTPPPLDYGYISSFTNSGWWFWAEGKENSEWNWQTTSASLCRCWVCNIKIYSQSGITDYLIMRWIMQTQIPGAYIIIIQQSPTNSNPPFGLFGKITRFF